MAELQKLSEHRIHRRVQFYETDAAGIVHFSCFFRYMEEAEHALWRAAGLSIFPSAAEHGWPRVAASCDYRKPLCFEDEFEIVVRIAAMSDKSIRYACEIVRGGEVAAALSMTIVCVEKTPDGPYRAVAIPEAVRARFEVSPDVAAGLR
jgi:YbgC/YbaW family acyl-CoA thioester hydrolase